MRRHLVALALVAPFTAPAAALDLHPRQVAPDTFVVVGQSEDFDRDNAGDIANSAFIVTRAGVVVIDSGASLAYGEALRALIRRHTGQPVVLLLNTHHHPDHWFGNQGFEDVEASALSATMRAMREEHEGFANNLYRMVGDAMRGTEPRPATREVGDARFDVGGHTLELIALDGHSAGDLVVLDHTTGVLFAGDLVFLDRAPTTPHADLAAWRTALARIAELPWQVIVPGHGRPHADARGIEQTRAYLAWLDETLERAAREGADMAEVLAAPLPAWVAAIPLAAHEYARSVTHLYGARERAALAAPAAE